MRRSRGGGTEPEGRNRGKQQAGYTPVVSDGRRLFLIGYHELIGLVPAKR
jgi:hypothetical protein